MTTQTSFALLTTTGRAKLAAALANDTTVNIVNIGIGDGATVPSGGETALYHQLALKTISGHGTVVGADNVAYFDCYLTAEEGPYTISEAGLFDDAGALIAIAHYDPPINKPTPDSGQTVEGTVRIEVAFSDVSAVTIMIDPAMQVALQRLTRLPWIPVNSISVTAPPATPAVGDVYVPAAPATGSWTGQEGKVAEYTTAGWAIISPPNGHGIGLPDGTEYIRIAGIYILRGKVASAITASGIAFSQTAQSQLAEAMSRTASGGVFYADSGAANAYVLAAIGSFVQPSAYFDGMEISFIPANVSTGASTVKVGTLAAVPLKSIDGSDVIAGQVADLLMARYHAATSTFLLAPWSKPAVPQYLLASVAATQSIPYGTLTALNYSSTNNTLGAGCWDGTKFTAPKSAMYNVSWRATLVSAATWLFTFGHINLSLAPSSPFTPGAWDRHAYFEQGSGGVSVATEGDIFLSKGEQIFAEMLFTDSAGSGAASVTQGKLFIGVVD